MKPRETLFSAIGLTRDSAGDWGRGFFVALVVALTIRWAFAEPYRIPSESMEPTLHGDPGFLRGDRVFINKWVFGLRLPFTNKRILRGGEPERFDIVVFNAVEPNAEFPRLVKRVIGLPGERIHIEEGTIYVNGVALRFPESMPQVEYTSAGDFGVRTDDTHAVVPDGHYLLLGDNSATSRDGRYFGWVPQQNLLGRAFCIMWPVNRWRDFTGFTGRWWFRAPLVLFGVYSLFRLFVGRTWRVHSSRLGDPVHDGERVYINRIAFGLPIPFARQRLIPGREPRRGECVLYWIPKEGSAVTIGLVAALPGDTFKGKNGNPVLVPDGRYLIAREGRLAHLVQRDDLIGPVSAVWWPLSQWRSVRT